MEYQKYQRADFFQVSQMDDLLLSVSKSVLYAPWRIPKMGVPH